MLIGIDLLETRFLQGIILQIQMINVNYFSLYTSALENPVSVLTPYTSKNIRFPLRSLEFNVGVCSSLHIALVPELLRWDSSASISGSSDEFSIFPDTCA